MTSHSVRLVNTLAWGSVPDWITVIVACITAYYLWKTLKSQTIVQKYQYELLKIEFKRYSNSTLPNFGMEISGFDKELFITAPGKVHDSNRYAYNIGFKFQLKTKHASIVKIQVKKPNEINFDDHANVYQYNFINKEDCFELQYFANGVLSIQYFNNETYWVFGHIISFELTYNDDLGNYISQSISYNVNSISSPDPVIEIPIIINSPY